MVCKFDGHVLAIELGFFDQNREKWFKHHGGKFALIKGVTIQGFYDTQNRAYEIGCQVWGVVPFLIKEVLLEDRVIFMPYRVVVKAKVEDQDEHSVI